MLKVIARDDLKRPPLDMRKIVPPGMIDTLPKLYGVHGTTAQRARELLVDGAFKRGIEYTSPNDVYAAHAGFFFYLASGTCFDFEDEWDVRVKINDIYTSLRESIIGAAGYGMKKAAELSEFQGLSRAGLGIILLELGQPHLDLIIDDPDQDPDDLRDSFLSDRIYSKCIPVEKFEQFICPVGAVTTDDWINKKLHRVVEEFGDNSTIPLYMEHNMFGLDFKRLVCRIIEFSISTLIELSSGQKG